ncbi:uncharacterized protein [Watersipora subatra]|uniref:uncharacterized protein n=1 Tax=Watersipora subatra TaxID=2589382 RepID=UPI00355B9D9E
MSMGRDCSLCKPDYFGDPRDGGECFRCYHGRTIILNFSGTDNYGSRYCHPGIEFTSASMFMWHFETDDSSVPSHFLMFTLADFNSPDLNPVYIYDHQPNSVLSDAQPLAILTKKDIGRNISSLTGVLVVIHHGASFANEPMLKFKIAKRSCPTSCFGEESLCSSKDQCYCPLGTVWTICEGELFCFPFGNETNCGNTTDYMRGRSKSASSGNSQAIYIHGGVTAGGKLLDDMQVWNKSSSSLTLLGSLVSARYGHALECTEYACFLYGGITRDSSGSSRLAHIGSSSGDPFYINSQFYHLSLDTEPRGWTTLENKLCAYLLLISSQEYTELEG